MKKLFPRLIPLLLCLVFLFIPLIAGPAMAAEAPPPDFDSIAFELPTSVPWALAIVLGVIFLDAAIGGLIAYKRGNFELTYLPRFLLNNVWPWAGTLGLLAIFSYLGAWFEGIYILAAGLIGASFAKQVGYKLTELIHLLNAKPPEDDVSEGQ